MRSIKILPSRAYPLSPCLCRSSFLFVCIFISVMFSHVILCFLPVRMWATHLERACKIGLDFHSKYHHCICSRNFICSETPLLIRFTLFLLLFLFFCCFTIANIIKFISSLVEFREKRASKCKYHSIAKHNTDWMTLKLRTLARRWKKRVNSIILDKICSANFKTRWILI